VQYAQRWVLVIDDEGTVITSHYVAQSLHGQEIFQAERLSRAVIDDQMQPLGKENCNTLKISPFVARSLFEQEKYQKAERLFREVLNNETRVRNKNDKTTLV
jgi:hypothetical protein